MNERYIKIRNISRTPLILEKWRKTKLFVLSDKGRWGPKWLQRLVLRAATNLGMIQHEKSYFREETVKTTVIDIKDKKIGEKIFALSQPFIDDGYRPEELLILCGPDFIEEAMADVNYNHYVMVGSQYLTPKLYGFPMAVVNHLEGAIVIPKQAVWKAAK